MQAECGKVLKVKIIKGEREKEIKFRNGVKMHESRHQIDNGAKVFVCRNDRHYRADQLFSVPRDKKALAIVYTTIGPR